MLYPSPHHQLTLQLRPLSKFAPSIVTHEGELTPINSFTRNKAISTHTERTRLVRQ